LSREGETMAQRGGGRRLAGTIEGDRGDNRNTRIMRSG
jgi:hypothetical protein